jgi:hypothetical protein
MRARLFAPLLLAALVVGGCPQPPDEGEPAPEAPTPDEPFLFTGTVNDYDGLPVAGVELAVGDGVTTSGQDGGFGFELDDGPPVQLDVLQEAGRVESRLTCAEQERVWFWTGSISTPVTATLELVVHGIEDRSRVRFVWVYEVGDADWSYVSWSSYSGLWLQESEPGVWGATLQTSPNLGWVLLASEARADGTVTWDRVDGVHALDAGETVQLELQLEEAAGGVQVWDGQVDAQVRSITLRERIEVMGRGVFLPVLITEPDGLPVDVPVLDAHLGVLEYDANLVLDSAACDSADVTLDAAPVFPPDTLTLPDMPDPVTVAAEGDPSRPEFSWTGVQSNAWIYADVWDSAGEVLLSDWYLGAARGCGDRGRWPVSLEPIGPEDRLELRISTYGEHWSAWCEVTVEPGQ